MVKFNIKYLIVIALQFIVTNTILSQKITSGLVESGVIDFIVIDSTKRALEDIEFLTTKAMVQDKKEYFYFNHKYQIEIDTLSNGRLTKKFTDVENGLKYIYYDSSGAKFYAIDSMIYQFDRDENLKNSRDSLTRDFEIQRSKSDTIKILDYKCYKITQSKYRRNEQGYFYFYTTHELGTNYMEANPLRYCIGYPIRMVVAIEKDLEMVHGIRKITYIHPENEIFERPNTGYKQVSYDELLDKIYR